MFVVIKEHVNHSKGVTHGCIFNSFEGNSVDVCNTGRSYIIHRQYLLVG